VVSYYTLWKQLIGMMHIIVVWDRDREMEYYKGDDMR